MAKNYKRCERCGKLCDIKNMIKAEQKKGIMNVIMQTPVGTELLCNDCVNNEIGR